MVWLVSCIGRMVGNTDVIVARLVTALSEDVIDGALIALRSEIAQPLTSVVGDGIEFARYSSVVLQ